MGNNSFLIIMAIVVVVIFIRAKHMNKKRKEDKLISGINSNRRIKRPKVKRADGTKKTKNELDREMADYYQQLQSSSIRKAQAEKIKAQRLGSKTFVWRSCGDGDVCPACKKNNGKKFRWDSPPATGLPGEGKCCLDGLCRCYPEIKF